MSARLRKTLGEMVASEYLGGERLRLVGEIVIAEAAFRQRLRDTDDVPPTEYEIAIDVLQREWQAFVEEEDAGGYLRVGPPRPDPFELALRAMLQALTSSS